MKGKDPVLGKSLGFKNTNINSESINWYMAFLGIN